MIKKVFVGVLLAAVFGLLVFGAVNRTLAKTEESEPLALSENLLERVRSENGNGQNQDRDLQGDFASTREEGNGIGNGTGLGSGNRNNESAVGGSETPNGMGRQGSAPADGFGTQNGTGKQGSNAGVGQDGQQEGAPADGFGLGQADVKAWITETGIIESVSPDLWVIKLSDGTFLELEGQALRYLNEQGFSVNVGDSVTLTGFFDGDKFEIGQIENTALGTIMSIRDENGRPYWAGGSQGRSLGGNQDGNQGGRQGGQNK